jgi:hypothetical protein
MLFGQFLTNHCSLYRRGIMYSSSSMSLDYSIMARLYNESIICQPIIFYGNFCTANMVVFLMDQENTTIRFGEGLI